MSKTKNTRKKKVSLSETDRIKFSHKKDVRITMENIGFHLIPDIEGKNFVYKNRKSELDDFFVYENIVLLVEYTVQSDVSKHLNTKKTIYDLINDSHRDFIDFALIDRAFASFQQYYDHKIRGKYSNSQLHIRILYCSFNNIDAPHKALFSSNNSVCFYDYDIVQYFKQLALNIKRTARYEFFDFLGLHPSEIGPTASGAPSANVFVGNILPVERSSFDEGYNVVSFYIDADSLMRRAYVLRQECWREEDASGLYQRMVIGKKISNMRKYLTSEGRVFINNIIATLSNDSAKLLDKDEHEIHINERGIFEGNQPTDMIMPSKVEIKDCPNIIGIIDGQHRVFAYHEGNDVYEERIAEIRHKQHLLVTAILFPKNEDPDVKRRFEAKLFREINVNQTNISSTLKQEIDVMIYPFSTTAVCKNIISKLNQSGPLRGMIEIHSYEKGKLKTASIISYGLTPLVKFDDTSSSDSLFRLWANADKQKLTNKDCHEYDLMKEYVDFCAEKIRDILIALKGVVDTDTWQVYNPKTKQGCLSVTFINGFLNAIRCQIKSNQSLLSVEEYKNRLNSLNLDELRSYKSSQYNKMGRMIYSTYIANPE